MCIYFYILDAIKSRRRRRRLTRISLTSARVTSNVISIGFYTCPRRATNDARLLREKEEEEKKETGMKAGEKYREPRLTLSVGHSLPEDYGRRDILMVNQNRSYFPSLFLLFSLSRV